MYHSEHGQDMWLEENVFKGRQGGVFVEFGALDGTTTSNTLFFERERNWRGLCIEAHPDAFRKLVERRKCQCLNCAVYDRVGVTRFEKFDGGLFGWSGIAATIEPQHQERIDVHIPKSLRETLYVPCDTLANILVRYGLTRVDYMSVDVEGAEEAILRAFPFERFVVDVWDIENNWGQQQIAQTLEPQGYRRIAQLGPNEIYRLEEHVAH